MKLFTLIILLSSLSLTACTQTANDPAIVAEKYWQHLQTGNLTEAEKLVSADSRHAFSTHSDRMASIARLNNGEAKTVVSTTITTVYPDSNYSHTQTFDTVLVLEGGHWKVDASQSTLPPTLNAREEELQKLTEDLSDSMQENIESIDDAMTQGMEMLNEALHEGSKEMSESMLQMLNELNSSMQESIDQMKQRRQQQLQEQQEQEQEQEQQRPPQPQPDPRKGEGMI
jgi:DNA anti-recombination protein RmuC